MRKVLIVGDASSVHTLKWCKLAARHVEVHLASLEDTASDVSTYLKFYRLKGKKPFGYMYCRSELRRLIKIINPEILHAHYATGYGLLGCTQPVQTKVLSVWGSDVYRFPRKSLIHLYIFQYILKKYNTVTSTSKGMAVEVSKITGKFDIKVIPFGIDTIKFSVAEVENSEAEQFTIGTVKTLEHTYGIDILIRAFSIVQTRLKNHRLKLCIYGKGSKRDELETLANQLCEVNTVEFRGGIKNIDVPNVLSTFNIFSALSREESFGVSMLEAMSMCLPVVSTATVGPSEFITNNENGILVPIDNSVLAAEALIRLIQDGKFRRKIGVAARETVVRNFSEEIMQREIEQLYRSEY